MSAPTRNAPCPCGSSIKYKKCCLPKVEAAAAAAAPPAGGRVVHHRGQWMYASRGVSLAELDRAADHFARQDRGERPASKMMRFAAPLLDMADGDHARMDLAFTLAAVFWNLALCEDEQRDEMLAGVMRGLVQDEHEATAFRLLAAEMVERHRHMFPELHARPENPMSRT